MFPPQSHQSTGAAEKDVSTVRGLARTHLTVLKDKSQFFEVTTHFPNAAWDPIRYDVRRDTRITLCNKIRGQQYRKKILPQGEQVLAVQNQCQSSFFRNM